MEVQRRRTMAMKKNECARVMWPNGTHMANIWRTAEVKCGWIAFRTANWKWMFPAAAVFVHSLLHISVKIGNWSSSTMEAQTLWICLSIYQSICDWLQLSKNIRLCWTKLTSAPIEWDHIISTFMMIVCVRHLSFTVNNTRHLNHSTDRYEYLFWSNHGWNVSQ